MTAVLVALLIAAAVQAGRPGSAARERLFGPRAWVDPSRLRRFVQPVSTGPRLLLAAAGTTAAVAGVLGGPVAAVLAAAYVGLGVHEWGRWAERKRHSGSRSVALDDLAHLVAELRAGIPPVIVAASATSGTSSVAHADADGGPRVERLTGAVWRLAERTGAPAADLLERIEWDARAADRSAKAAAAQASGAQTTAMLLAALPLAGIGMGYLIGGDPVDVLLHTPWGAGCAIVAMLLQCAGLKWAQQLTAKVAG